MRSSHRTALTGSSASASAPPIFESAVICEYLDETHAPRLHAPDALQRAHDRAWVEFGSVVLGLLAAFYNAPTDDALHAKRGELAARFTELDQRLATRAYLTGDAFTVADAYAFAIVNWTSFLGISLKPYPSLAAYLDRVAARPKVREALIAEGLVKAAN